MWTLGCDSTLQAACQITRVVLEVDVMVLLVEVTLTLELLLLLLLAVEVNVLERVEELVFVVLESVEVLV